MPKKQNPHFFTLIELLVSIGIIAILAGLFMPVASDAKFRSKYIRWQAYNAMWNNDSHVVLNFNFQDMNFKASDNGVFRSAVESGAAACVEEGFDQKLYHGILRNGPTWVKNGGRWGFNNALQLDGINDYVEVMATKALDFDPSDRDISLMMWLYFDITTGIHTLFSKSRWVKSAQYDAYLYNNRIEADVGTVAYGWEEPRIKAGKWVHIAFTSDVNGEFQLYYNGKMMGEWRDDTFTAQEVMADATFIIGAAGMENGPPKYHFKGRFDELILLSRRLTPGEIRGHYVMGNPN